MLHQLFRDLFLLFSSLFSLFLSAESSLCVMKKGEEMSRRVKSRKNLVKDDVIYYEG